MPSSQGVSVAASSPVSVPVSEASRHKCLIYDGHASEQLPVVVPFLLESLQNNWRCLYVGSPEDVHMVEHAFQTHGVNLLRETKRGALVLSSDRSHLKAGTFDPRAMVQFLAQAVDDAVKAGFVGLCATGDMRWELGDDKNLDRLMEYEALLEQLFREKSLRGICQYRRDILPARTVQHALATHRSAYVGQHLKEDNFFYIPPEMVLEADSGVEKVGEWMCQQIVRVLDAESSRDKALHALKDSEAQQRALATELAEANRHLEKRVEERTLQLQQANRELEAFSYSVSHDLRSPLQRISGFVSILAEDYEKGLDDAGRDCLARIQAGTRQMGELITDLLRLANLSQTKLKAGPVQLSTIAQSVVKTLQANDPEREIEVRIEDNIATVGDSGLLWVVMENLLSNSWKYTSKVARPLIEFGTISEPDGNTYFVRDNGAGFDMKYADKLFTPFQRLHGPSEFAGHGIGLATVERIVNRHGGRIWAKAEPGRGATFYFTLSVGSL
jgi:signal transduction histidine kinase